MSSPKAKLLNARKVITDRRMDFATVEPARLAARSAIKRERMTITTPPETATELLRGISETYEDVHDRAAEAAIAIKEWLSVAPPLPASMASSTLALGRNPSVQQGISELEYLLSNTLVAAPELTGEMVFGQWLKRSPFASTEYSEGLELLTGDAHIRLRWKA